MRKLTLLILALLLVLTTSCVTGEPSSQEEERDRQQSNYDELVARAPAQTMSNSPTRDTINFWIETWDEPGKLAFVYLMAGNGELIGYYVLEGLPVSYCASLTPTYRIRPSTNGNLSVPAPAMDGVYYSGSECGVYYGKDATTGTYIEFSTGFGINFLLYEEPLPRQDVQPLGQTTIEDVESQ